ncbi:helix-turn-helix transcriptional regulator [Streptomyces sp. DSM 44917]|uniref:Helix-turn-helix transcriptional regulator n=1 Tax=Streptomyces boetiae TaxID=3075541 RepID=A0ABU2LAR1_9ACTN|nr:helix-turn-helix transcriptional regulator [Streptomyces sp. DSM 44917]MDT0308639.1 helix-turn-helix transcriptional regulator [Streptomyces sp. DSM 44917]
MTTADDMGACSRRGELAAFLRSRRERIPPERVGLARGRRRRTPGLRREEVAQLANVGVTWYTWLEQARNIQVSAGVLDAIARALLFDAHERAHLFVLAGATDPAPGAESTGVPPVLHAMLRQLEPVPACVQNARYDILAYNRTYGRLLCDLDALPPEDRNCMLLAFTHEGWERGVVDREETLRMMAANFRAAMAEHLAEPAWRHMVRRMQRESEEFRALWERHEVARAPVLKVKRFRNEDVGLLHVNAARLWLGPQAGSRLIAYFPDDEETRERLERLGDLAGVRAGRGAGAGSPGPEALAELGEWETAVPLTVPAAKDPAR